MTRAKNVETVMKISLKLQMDEGEPTLSEKKLPKTEQKNDLLNNYSTKHHLCC